MRRISAMVIVAALAGGCSLLIDNGAFVGDGRDAGDGMTDAGVDGGPGDAGPDAPTTPEIRIDPAAPRTLDDLSVVIDVESTDPLEMGAVTYEYAWTRDGGDTGETGATISHELTAKDQVWVLSVTPVTADDRRGLPATASVTIENTPPMLRTVGLSHYRPILGDSVQALLGASEDPDGDSLIFRYRWFRNGSELEASGGGLPLVGEIVEGDEIRVEAIASDGESDSPPVDAGGAVVVSATTRWIQHWPNRNKIGFAAYDPVHQRFLITTRDPAQLWELDLAHERFVQLRPGGEMPPDAGILTPPLTDGQGRFWSFAQDEATSEFSVFLLQADQRGREQWRELALSGDRPEWTLTNGVVYGDRLIFLAPSASMTGLELWSLDVGGSEGALNRLPGSVPFDLYGGTWVRTTGTDVLVLGGFDLVTGSDRPSDRVFRLDMAALEDGFSELTARLPTPRGFAPAAFDADSGLILFGFGVGSEFMPATGLYSLDPNDGTITELSGGSIDDAGVGSLMVEDAWAEGLLLVRSPGPILWPRSFELFRLQSSTTGPEPVHAFGTTAPPPVAAAVAGGVGGDFLIYGGRGVDDVSYGEAWAAGLDTSPEFEGFAALEITPDPLEGTPGPRGRLAVAHGDPGLTFFGGESAPGTLASTTPTWRLERGAWAAVTLASGETPPPGRSDATFFDLPDTCAAEVGVFGGSGTSNDLLFLECASTDSECRWFDPGAAGTTPSQRTYPAVHSEPAFSSVFIVGGDSRSVIDVHRLNCGSAPPSWTELTVLGDLPRGLRGHSIDEGIMFGGMTNSISSYSNKAYTLTVSVSRDEVTLTELVPATDGDGIPPARSSHASFGQRRSGAGSYRRRIFIYGGTAGPLAFSTFDDVFADTWELRVYP